ncbi:MAG TPA: TlpA disulfide reductase family protein [Puia sp.]|jgi:thiol-disulfide isomerase/thioredoxin
MKWFILCLVMIFQPASWVGKPFPAATFIDTGHNVINIEKLKGSIVVINCWSIHCGPCVAEIPDLNRLVDSFAGKNVVWLGLTYDQLPEMEAFFHSQKAKEVLQMGNPAFKFRLIGDQKDFLANTLRVGVYPMTFIVGTDGIIREVIKGMSMDKDGKPKTYEKMRSALDRWMR